MANIGDLVVTIDANTQGLERGMQRGRKQLDNINDGMGRTIGIAKRLTGVLGALGLGIGLGQAVRQIADFQAAMNGLAATSNATAEQMDRLEKQARELGAVSQFSAQQAAEGQRFLAQAGFEVNEILGATPGILKLAAAGGLDLASAADIASNVLGGMRLEVDQLNRVNDVLAATASRSNTNIQQLGQALSFAAPFAAGAGISIEEAAAAIGVMSDAGIQASRAGTGLVGTIRQLSKVTDTGAEVLERHGLSLADVNIEARGLGPVLDTLRSANLTTAEAIALFGSEAGAAAQVLVNDYAGGITNATGESERMAEQLEQGLGPAFKSLGSAASEAVLQMGDAGLAGALEGLVRTATGVVNTFNGLNDEFTGTVNTAKVLVTLIGTRLVAALGVYAGSVAFATQQSIAYQAALARMAGASALAAGSARALSGALAFVGGPLGLLVGTAGLLFVFREELGLVSDPAKEAREEVELLTGALEDMNNASISAAMIGINSQLFELERQARETRLELEEASQRGGSGALGMAPGATSAQARLQGRLGQIGVERAALESRQQELMALTEGVGELSSVISDEAIDAAIRVTSASNEAADALEKFSASLSPEVESILERAGPGATIDAEGQIRDAFGNTLPSIQRDLDKEMQNQIRNFSNEQNLQRGLEAAAENFMNGANKAVRQAFGSITPMSTDAVNEAIGEAKNIGSLTFKLERSDGSTGETNVEGDADDLRRLANLFSGVASAA